MSKKTQHEHKMPDEPVKLNARSSWICTIMVTNLGIEKNIEVTNNTHIGQVMTDLVDKLDIQTDWSDHAIWWPDKKTWLLKARVTLATHGITRDCKFDFTPQHKTVCMRMPDMQRLDMRVNFALNVFNAVKEICADIGIRHPEELSLLRPKFQGSGTKKRAKKKNSKDHIDSHASSDETGSQGSMGNGTLNVNHSQPPMSPVSPNDGRGDMSFDSLNPYSTPLSPMLAHSPRHASNDSLDMIGKGKSLQARSEMNSGWMYSNASLMEQDVNEYDTLLLRFKYYNFFDLNAKIDGVRINQIYEQAKYQILTEEIECTEDEAVMFAAYMLQVQIASTSPHRTGGGEEVDDIESALSELQMTLEGAHEQTDKKPARPVLTYIPEMKETLNLHKTKKMGLKSVKPYYFQFKDTHIAYYKEQSQSNPSNPPIQKFNIKDCTVTPNVNVAKNKFNIKLKIPGPDMTELELGCTSEEQYIRWMAACRLASKGRTMADPTYEMEKSGAKVGITLQRTDGGGEDSEVAHHHHQINVEQFIPHKWLVKYAPKKLIMRIMEAQSTITYLSLIDAKLKYINNWMQLPDFGYTTFNCKFEKKKEEILVIGVSKIVQRDPQTCAVIREWRYSAMKNWNVNWETSSMLISIAEREDAGDSVGETDGHTQIQFAPSMHTTPANMCDIRIIHEFIGGYVFLTMRKNVNTPPNDEQFYKMTASGFF